MGYVPGFQTDVFISYSHLDNKAVGGKGWVTEFKDRLAIELGGELGQEAQVWLDDDRLGAADDFSRALERQVRSAAVLVAVVSPGYLNSPWCDWEMNGFVRWAAQSGNLYRGTKCRAIKAIKKPDPDNGHRTRVLIEGKGIEFFEADDHSNCAYELAIDTEPYRRLISRLAQEIREILRDMRKSRTVFLGAAPHALEDQRTKIKQELEDRGFDVRSCPGASGEADRDAINAQLDQSSQSFFFIDQGAAPRRGENRAGAGGVERELAAVAGVPQTLVVKDDRPDAADAWRGLESVAAGPQVEIMLNPSTQRLKEVAVEKMASAATAPGSSDLVRVYLVCDQDDNPLLRDSAARTLRDELMKHGFEVKLPLADRAREGEFSRDNRAKLKQCDAVLVYWGTSGQSWFEKRLEELTLARGWRRGRAFKANAAYVAGPANAVKLNYATREVEDFIKSFDPQARERFEAFVARLAAPVQS